MFGIAKTRVVWLSDDEKQFDDMLNRLNRILACDGQTDGQTEILPRHSPRYAQHRAVKMKQQLV